jgi:hypothetical protein
MADRTTEEVDLALGQELVARPAGFSLERIEATPQEQRPDFKMVSWRGLVGYCEVKSPRDDCSTSSWSRHRLAPSSVALDPIPLSTGLHAIS